MSLLNTQTVQQNGITPTMTPASSGGDTFNPGATTILLLQNSDSASHTVTITVTAEDFGQPVQAVVITVPANGQAIAGPYLAGEVANPSTGQASVAYSDAAVLTVAVLAV